MKKNKKSVRKRILAVILAIGIAASTGIVYGDDWEGWTEENQELAWFNYVATDWNALVSTLNFSTTEDGSIASADVPDSFREEYESYVEAALMGVNISTIYSNSDDSTDKTAYKELILAMGYVMYEEGNSLFGENDIDVLHINDFFGTNYSIKNISNSFYRLFYRFAMREKQYIKKDTGIVANYSLFSSNEYLGAVIQATFYGRGYLDSVDTYSEDNAKEYYESHTNSINFEWNDFAEEVLSIYTGIKSTTDNTIIG